MALSLQQQHVNTAEEEDAEDGAEDFSTPRMASPVEFGTPRGHRDGSGASPSPALAQTKSKLKKFSLALGHLASAGLRNPTESEHLPDAAARHDSPPPAAPPTGPSCISAPPVDEPTAAEPAAATEPAAELELPRWGAIPLVSHSIEDGDGGAGTWFYKQLIATVGEAGRADSDKQLFTGPAGERSIDYLNRMLHNRAPEPKGPLR